MVDDAIRHVVIVGGGTAGWMTAAALANFLNPELTRITLIESEQIGTVGVGEATLPHIRYFNQTLGIDESEFLRATNATYKLGIEFSNWGKLGDAYIHPFGDYGVPIANVPFHQFWRAVRNNGEIVGSISDFSLPVVAANAGKFDFPASDEQSILATYGYAFHLDASRYAQFLREYAEARGVTRIEGKIENIVTAPNGEIAKLELGNSQQIEAELYIDCSGFRSLLLGNKLQVPFNDWSEWLRCDRAVAVPCVGDEKPLPFTRAIAHEFGWQWRIPLQHRIGNGMVYCSDFVSDDEALARLQVHLDGEPLAEPNFVGFKAGHRARSWEKNCVAVGLSAGFLEPLESTSIYLIQVAITKLLELFPRPELAASLRDEYNAQMTLAFERVRDFLILHYHATQRNDSEFWNYCRTMPVPDELAHKMSLFKQRGYVVQYDDGVFLEPSWVAVYLGQNIVPSSVDPRVENFNLSDVAMQMRALRERICSAVDTMPTHGDSLHKQVNLKKGTFPKASFNLYGRSNT